VLTGVKQDASGHALATTLAIAHGIGAFMPQGAVVESSFEEETMVDLFSEHTWAGAMLFLLERAYKLLGRERISPEVAMIELYASGELGEIGRAMASMECGTSSNCIRIPASSDSSPTARSSSEPTRKR